MDDVQKKRQVPTPPKLQDVAKVLCSWVEAWDPHVIVPAGLATKYRNGTFPALSGLDLGASWTNLMAFCSLSNRNLSLTVSQKLPRCENSRLATFSPPYAGTCAIASEILVFGGCKCRNQGWLWTIWHVRSFYIYHTLMLEYVGGVVCVVKKICFSQPLWTLRMDGTPIVVPLVPEVRLFLFCNFCLSM